MIMNYKKPIVFTAAAAALLVVGATAAFAADAKVDTNDTPAQTTDSSVSDSAVSSVTSEPVTSEPVTSEPITSEPITSEPATDKPYEKQLLTADNLGDCEYIPDFSDPLLVEAYRVPVLDHFEGSGCVFGEIDENGNMVHRFIPMDFGYEPGCILSCVFHNNDYAIIEKRIWQPVEENYTHEEIVDGAIIRW